ncbi:carbohydrate ABC transporter permease [Cohnella thailandensis]|uniref:Carbohydrate ABC transporter permease n=1 Tax=Cohnella thailandensis TaxID=557557 RepID=A0A841STR7_9BACL|nr:carbohydrate ABC transporter permease [Cohnella thailandensis]MBB6633986.1 carbohydrate ABC transporter permease [Cohnella thailandensis]MBP1972671.1 putative aldouronate transport system permease protein [Cohnella thailandensis]
MNKTYRTFGGTVFDAANYIVLSAIGIAAVLPFLYVVAGSFASDTELTQRAFFIVPHSFSLMAYKYIFSTDTILHSLMNSMYVTVVGTLVNLVFTVTMAYGLSKKNVAGRNMIMNLIIFSMLFGGGLIPTYLVVRELQLLDSYWALMLPGAISAFNLIIVKNFFQELPPELEEAAKIDGCSDLSLLWRIVLPLSMPVLATFTLFYAVGHWNNFFSALLYINDPEKWPLQVMLRQIVLLSQMAAGSADSVDYNYVQQAQQSIKMAVIVVGTLPILFVYPFLQKHFAKGVLIGSVKG